jgi:cyclopropane fatty-acyl-phospholipid synthase-like methyltransferase
MKLNINDYWESRYATGGNSGNGSYGKLAEYKAKFINDFIKEKNIKSLLEYGCGDGNQLAMIDCEKIMAFDISKTALELCKSKVDCETFNKFKDIKETPELILSLDVIYHLVNDVDYNVYMSNLIGKGAKYLIIYSVNEEMDNMAAHVKPRIFTNLINNYTLIKKEINPFKSLNHKVGSFSDFYIYEINS